MCSEKYNYEFIIGIPIKLQVFCTVSDHSLTRDDFFRHTCSSCIKNFPWK